MSAVRVIRRYSNRKLYDTTESHYVTLEDLGRLVREGTDFRVIVYDTDEDITGAILAEVIFEEEKLRPRLSPRSLQKIIRSGLPTG